MTADGVPRIGDTNMKLRETIRLIWLIHRETFCHPTKTSYISRDGKVRRDD